MIHNNSPLQWVSYLWNFRHRLARYSWYDWYDRCDSYGWYGQDQLLYVICDAHPCAQKIRKWLESAAKLFQAVPWWKGERFALDCQPEAALGWGPLVPCHSMSLSWLLKVALEFYRRFAMFMICFWYSNSDMFYDMRTMRLCAEWTLFPLPSWEAASAQHQSVSQSCSLRFFLKFSNGISCKMLQMFQVQLNFLMFLAFV